MLVSPPPPECILVIRNNGKVVGVTNIVFYPQFMLHKLVELVHIDIGKNLRATVANRQTFGKTLNNFFKQPHSVFISNTCAQDRKKYAMVNTVKKLFDVALQNIARLNVILRYFSHHLIKCCNSSMRSVPNATGKRGRDESGLKHGIDNGEHGMMKYAVSHRSFVDTPLLWIVNIKSLICSMPIR